jgi:O-antigen ligase
MVLELAGTAMIALLAIEPSGEPVSSSARFMLLVAIVAVLVAALQLVPLPSAIWTQGPRARIASDYALLGRGTPWLPVSLAPAASVDALLKFIPPLAMFSWVIRQAEYKAALLAGALLSGTIAGVLLGVLQVAGGENSPWYLFRETNVGFVVGFFANANHMADLLVISLPFVAALAASNQQQAEERRSAAWVLLGAMATLILAGIALNHSLAALALSIPVAFASAAIAIPTQSGWRRATLALAGLSVVFAIVALSVSSIGATKVGQDAKTSVQSRSEILATTGRAIRDFMPLGSGLGSFVKVYRLYESPESVTTEYVIHAHDDYAEIVLEMGVPGILLLLAFLGCWAKASRDVWKRGSGAPLTRAASISSGVVLVHSFVDYPLRTIAISTCFAMFMALLADRKRRVFMDTNELRPARHIVIR